MLNQKEGGIKQNEIRKIFGFPVGIVAERLLKMEKEGLIKRIWENEDYIYTIFCPNNKKHLSPNFLMCKRQVVELIGIKLKLI
ncbi:MAG: hypothetical protein A2041_08435 [Bacteroidetes bacterium GWA2_31_9b]|nr:MAG: hypothetical protein A2041_08435 [Bacteroidetes bacterium GWA2_31_9b]